MELQQNLVIELLILKKLKVLSLWELTKIFCERLKIERFL